MSQLICKNLSLGYEGKTITENINFTVEKGDYLCITGANGSGKTTLIKALLGINTAAGGIIEHGDGVEAGKIGYLPQQTDVQRDFPACVKEIVLSGCIGKSKSLFFGEKEKKLAEDSMKKLGIFHLSKSPYKKLSGGQQ
ncbi:MAG: ATP-binding cassette domain-containing protein, partial [Clostridia bacterium]|nr:ATP-binding cassette domain-containing protein [Clostridia bacterium]